MRITFLLTLLLLACAGAALATTADDLCPPTDDPCVVTGTVAVDEGSAINVGARTLLVDGRLDVGPGEMRIIARSVVVAGALRATGNDSTPGGTIRVLAESVDIDGTVDATGSSGGTIAVAVAGPLEVAGRINADHRAGDEGGGEISLDATSAVVRGSLTARGGSDDSGGDVSMSVVGALSFEGQVDVSGGDGGDIALSAGMLTVASRATLRTDATLIGCDGGDVTLTSGADLVLDGALASNGRAGNDDEGGGSGGTFTLDAAAGVRSASSGSISATGARPDGSGGDVDVEAGGAVELRAPIVLAADGNDGGGGSLLVDAAGAVDLAANVDASGDGGGEVVVSSGARLAVSRGVTIDATASGGGGGGQIQLRSATELSVDGTLRTDGSNNRPGSLIELRACTLSVERNGQLSSLRMAGRNVLVGRDAMVIAGRLRADASTGVNELRFPDALRRPLIVDGASIQPAAVEIVDALLEPCGAATPTVPAATPTRTSTPISTATTGLPSSTATRAATRTPPPPGPCVGDCNEDGAVSVDELILVSDVALGRVLLDRCASLDRNADGVATVDEPIAAVRAALGGCLP